MRRQERNDERIGRSQPERAGKPAVRAGRRPLEPVDGGFDRAKPLNHRGGGGRDAGAPRAPLEQGEAATALERVDPAQNSSVVEAQRLRGGVHRTRIRDRKRDA